MTGRYSSKCTTVLVIAMLVTGPLFAGQPQPDYGPELRAFLERFERAFTAGDERRVYELFHWQGVDGVDRDRVSLLIARDLSHRFVRAELVPTPTKEATRATNLPVVGRLRARFVAADGATRYSVHLLGLHEGRVYIALPVSAGGRSI